MEINRLIFDQGRDDYEVTGYALQDGIVVLNVRSNQKECECPACSINSSRLHSYYNRMVRDVSCFDKTVMIHLKARKFYCQNPSCATKIFSERFNYLTAPHQRTTNRLAAKLLKISLLVGGNAGSRLCNTLRIPASSSTLIRQIHRKKLPDAKKTTAIGIDDWAYRKGSKYGTVVVDLVQHQIIDLLPDREAATVTAWLNANPEIEVVSRDRYSNYATGVTNALPNAIQVERIAGT
ncbi:ISL3 family transposase [Pseudoflavitalea rhizosphaerae]|uniref:ISL3 family transposase n=1 Tax=Pseudoflavitalea rhizosphaerae TaxID=1884793 RepID=UPI000F8F14A9|nr:ISL3 family transposase [Pseudoflavitalea rhizosphaerae]